MYTLGKSCAITLELLLEGYSEDEICSPDFLVGFNGQLGLVRFDSDGPHLYKPVDEGDVSERLD